jgi:hypothetical protein
VNDRDDTTGVSLPEAAIEALEAGRRTQAIRGLTEELRLDEPAARSILEAWLAGNPRALARLAAAEQAAREQRYWWAAAAIAGALFFYVVVALP